MPKTLTPRIQEQLDNKDVRATFVFKIEGIVNTDLLSWSIRADRSFGTMAAQFALRNVDGKYSPGQSNEIKIGDEVELIERYGDDQTERARECAEAVDVGGMCSVQDTRSGAIPATFCGFWANDASDLGGTVPRCG